MNAGVVRLRGVRFGYEPARPILAGLDADLAAGERVALTGGNGAGKSTLLHLLVGLVKPQAGAVEAFGRVRQGERDFVEVRRRVGLVFQDSEDQLFCPTVLEDVLFGPLNLGRPRAAAETRARAALAALGLAGYEARVTHRLSAGEKKLAALASVLAMDPDVLLLDEPTAGLDDGARERLAGVLAAFGGAVVMASHDHDFLGRLTRREWCLADGRLHARHE